MNQESNEEAIGKAYAKSMHLSPTDLPGALAPNTKAKGKKSKERLKAERSAEHNKPITAADAREAARIASREKGELFIGGSLPAEAKLDDAVYREKMSNVATPTTAPIPPDPSIAAAKAAQQLTDAQNDLTAAKERLAAVNEKISQKTRERQRALNDIDFVDTLGSIERTLEVLRGNMHYAAVKAVEAAEEQLKRLTRNAPTVTEAEQTRKRWVALSTNLLIDEQKRVAEVKAQHARSIQQCNADLERYSVNAKAWEAKTLAIGGKSAVVQGKKEISDYWKGLR